MPSYSIEYRVTFPGRPEFAFTGDYAPDELSDDELGATIPTGEGVGDGEYQSAAWLPPRVPGLRGTLLADDQDTLRARLDAIMAACPVGPLGQLRARLVDDESGTIAADRFVWCRVSGRRSGKRDGMPSRSWGVDFRTASPVWWDWDLGAAVNLVRTGGGGLTALTPGGTERTRPVVTLVVTTPGRIILTVPDAGGVDATSITLDLTTAATYVLDCEARTLTRGGGAVNAVGEIAAGGFLALPSYDTSITTALSGGIALSALSVRWRGGWAFSG